MNYNDPIFLKQIENGETFVKKFPQNIGELLFFYTTNPAEKAEFSESQYKRSGIIIVAAGVIILLMLFIFDSSLLAKIIVGLLTIITILFGLGTMMGFFGRDYFIGENGYSIFTFKNSRNNIISQHNVSFDDINCILLREKRKYKQDSSNVYIGPIAIGPKEYDQTECNLKLAKLNDETVCIIEDYSYNYNEEETEHDYEYRFASKIQEVLLSRIFEQAMSYYENNKVISFPFVADMQKYVHGISIYENGDITLFREKIKKDCVTDIEEKANELIIEYTDSFGNKQNVSIILSKIANCDIMLHFLKLHHLIYEDNTAFSHYVFN